MEKFAYKVVVLERMALFEKVGKETAQGQGTEELIETALNSLGESGWELVSVILDPEASGLSGPAWAFLKKELSSEG